MGEKSLAFVELCARGVERLWRTWPCHRVPSSRAPDESAVMRPMVTLFLLLSALGSQSAVAATLVVDTTSDNGSAPFQACTAAPGDCSLRAVMTSD